MRVVGPSRGTLGAVAAAGALRAPLAIYVPATFALAAFSVPRVPAARLAALAAAGVLFWSLLEYAIHRFALHGIPRGRTRRYVAGQHLLHHRNPVDEAGIV